MPDNVRIMLVGPKGVGKTNLARRIAGEAFNPDQKPTNTFELPKDISFSDDTTKFHYLWDMTGDAEYLKFSGLIKREQPHIILFVVSKEWMVSEAGLAASKKFWNDVCLPQVQCVKPAPTVLLVVNKNDQVIAASKARDLASTIGVGDEDIFHCSAHTGYGVAELKAHLAKLIAGDKPDKDASTPHTDALDASAAGFHADPRSEGKESRTPSPGSADGEHVDGSDPKRSDSLPDRISAWLKSSIG